MSDINMPWTEQDVRRLLNSLRHPELACDPLGAVVCELTQSRTPNEAVRKLVERAFSNRGYPGTRLARLIIRCDLDGSLSHEGVASELGLSARQFYRHRTRAIRMLFNEISALAGADDLDGTIVALERLVDRLKEQRLQRAG